MGSIKSFIKKNENILLFFAFAILIRLSMLTVYYLFQDTLGTYLYIDDWKYENYAMIYSNISNGLFDLDAMNQTDSIIGGVKVAQFFFRYNAVLYKLTNSTFLLRFSNVLISSAVVFPLNSLTREVISDKAANIATLLYIILPYHVIMSVFVFKDIMMVFFFTSALYFVVRYFKTGKLNIIGLFFSLLPLPWIRDGLALFVLLLLFLFSFFRFYDRNKNLRVLFVIAAPIVLMVLLFVFRDTFNLLLSRVEFYMENGRVEGGGINFIRIDTLAQLYKLPFTWIFSTFFPISTDIYWTQWSDIIMNFNYTLLLISPAYILYMIFQKKSKIEWLFFLSLLGLHLAVITLVINIPRHYYFLHFYMIMGASAFFEKLKSPKPMYAYLATALIYIFMFIVAIILILN